MAQAHEIKLLTEDQLVRRHAAQRRRGEEAAAQETWEEIVLRNFDRIRTTVAAFKFAGGQRLAEHDHGSAATLAYLRVKSMTFRGHTVGELRDAVHQRVWNACMDYGRSELRHARHSGGSLDEPAFGEEGDRSRFEPDVARASRAAEELELSELGDSERADTYVTWVHQAIAEVSNAGHRAVLELTYIEKLRAAEIAERLQISLDNVYQRRRRGTVELQRIIRERRG